MATEDNNVVFDKVFFFDDDYDYNIIDISYNCNDNMTTFYDCNTRIIGKEPSEYCTIKYDDNRNNLNTINTNLTKFKHIMKDNAVFKYLEWNDTTPGIIDEYRNYYGIQPSHKETFTEWIEINKDKTKAAFFDWDYTITQINTDFDKPSDVPNASMLEFLVGGTVRLHFIRHIFFVCKKNSISIIICTNNLDVSNDTLLLNELFGNIPYRVIYSQGETKGTFLKNYYSMKNICKEPGLSELLLLPDIQNVQKKSGGRTRKKKGNKIRGKKIKGGKQKKSMRRKNTLYI